MGKQISIIIPTYNMEKYIAKCLDSLLIPEFDDVEVLVVNDGSKDRSSKIAHSYADRYPNSIRVIDKPNGNYGSCINVALPQCIGRYVKILDADDTFNTDAFSEFVRLLPEVDEDVIITNHAIVDEEGNVISRSSFKHSVVNNKLYSIIEAYSGELNSYVQMHRIAYKRRLFDKFSYHQTEGVSYTDSQWATIPMGYCSSVRFIDTILYRYLMGREGQTMDKSQIAKFISHFFTALKDTVEMYISATDDCCKELLTKHLTDVHEYIYMQVFCISSPEAYDALKHHDLKIKEIAPMIYESIGRFKYTPWGTFKIFSDIRNRNYPLDYKIPFFNQLLISVEYRLSKIFKYIF